MGRPVDANGEEIVQEYPKMLSDGRIAQSAADEAGLAYPKVITVGGDKPVKVTVDNAAEEARWRAVDAPKEPEPEDAPHSPPALPSDAPVEPVPAVLEDPDGAPPADPLDDVTVEMDNPAFQPPAKKKTTAAKKK